MTLSPPGREPTTVRVWKDGRLLRREDANGGLESIMGGRLVWRVLPGSALPYVYPRHIGMWAINDDLWLLHRPAVDFWEEEGLRQPPADAITPSQVCGRTCWRFKTSSPQGQSTDIIWNVDAVTGVIMRLESPSHGIFAEWTSLEIGAPIPSEMFEWPGPARLDSSWPYPEGWSPDR